MDSGGSHPSNCEHETLAHPEFRAAATRSRSPAEARPAPKIYRTNSESLELRCPLLAAADPYLPKFEGPNFSSKSKRGRQQSELGRQVPQPDGHELGHEFDSVNFLEEHFSAVLLSVLQGQPEPEQMSPEVGVVLVFEGPTGMDNVVVAQVKRTRHNQHRGLPQMNAASALFTVMP